MLLVLIVVSSITEIFAVGSIIPFITILTKQSAVTDTEGYSVLAGFLYGMGIDPYRNALLVLTVLFLFAIVFSSAVRLLLLVAETRLAFAAGNDISVDMYRRTLYQPYEAHLVANSSDVVSGVLIKAKRMIGAVIIPVIRIVNAFFLLLVFFIFFINIEPLFFLVGVSVFGLVYALIGLSFKRKLLLAGEIENREHRQVMQVLQEGLGGIRDVILDRSQDFHVRLFADSDHKLRSASAQSTLLASYPRYFIETLAISAFALTGFLIARSGQAMTDSLPFLASIAMAVQRLLPVLQTAFQGWANLKSISPMLADILRSLETPVSFDLGEASEPIALRESLAFHNVSFRYQTSDVANLSEINFIIRKGERIGVVGATGSGKSTLIDISMGLLEPASGSVLVDGVPLSRRNIGSWQRSLAHVPQSIFLADATIAENIALGQAKESIDQDLLIQAAKQAQIYDHIRSLPQGFDARIGERGVRISGGQRQRIGIARALYKRADIIILDEATSALDNDTERSVMQSVESMSEDITVIIVAHRISTLHQCDRIIELERGRVKRICTYQELLNGG
tara:strand:+ start:5961 stop:7661 length:1701 start_codon:yes stop_codon:yes gene_type:complete